MKNTLIALVIVLLLPRLLVAQNRVVDLGVVPTLNTTKQNGDYYERLRREGMPLYMNGTSAVKSGTFTAGQTSLIAIAALPGEAWVVENVTLSSSGTATVSYQERFGSALDPTPSSSSISIPVRKIGLTAGYKEERLFTSPHILTQGMICRVDAVSANTDPANELTLNVIGYKVSDDFNAPAERVILLIGDSISSGVGVSTAEEIYAYKLRNHLMTTTGKVWRVVRKTQFGITTSQMEVHRKAGVLDVERADLIIYNLGVNDSGNPSNYSTNLPKFLDYRDIRYKNVPTIICGPVTLAGASETAMVTVRSAASSIVSGYNDPKIIVSNLGTAYSDLATNTIDNIHPNTAGHVLMEAVLWASLIANSNYIYNLIK